MKNNSGINEELISTKLKAYRKHLPNNFQKQMKGRELLIKKRKISIKKLNDLLGLYKVGIEFFESIQEEVYLEFQKKMKNTLIHPFVNELLNAKISENNERSQSFSDERISERMQQRTYSMMEKAPEFTAKKEMEQMIQKIEKTAEKTTDVIKMDMMKQDENFQKRIQLRKKKKMQKAASTSQLHEIQSFASITNLHASKESNHQKKPDLSILSAMIQDDQDFDSPKSSGESSLSGQPLSARSDENITQKTLDDCTMELEKNQEEKEKQIEVILENYAQNKFHIMKTVSQKYDEQISKYGSNEGDSPKNSVYQKLLEKLKGEKAKELNSALQELDEKKKKDIDEVKKDSNHKRFEIMKKYSFSKKKKRTSKYNRPLSTKNINRSDMFPRCFTFKPLSNSKSNTLLGNLNEDQDFEEVRDQITDDISLHPDSQKKIPYSKEASKNLRTQYKQFVKKQKKLSYGYIGKFGAISLRKDSKEPEEKKE